jgi:putative colanic acid biosynthesis acetyltransferase WcaF
VQPELWDLSQSRSQLSLKIKLARAFWALTRRLLFAWTPKQFFNGWRITLLRTFGAKIGRGCVVCGSVKVLQPWRLELADYVWIGEECDVYSYDWIRIGPHSVISQRTFLCTGSHDWTKRDFPLVHKPIEIGGQVWINSECFVGPGVHIGEGAILLPRSVAAKDQPEWTFSGGQPSRPIKPRPRASN